MRKEEKNGYIHSFFFFKEQTVKIEIMSTNENSAEATTQSSKDSLFDDSYDDVSTVMRNPWDPLHSSEWDTQVPNATCLARIKR